MDSSTDYYNATSYLWESIHNAFGIHSKIFLKYGGPTREWMNLNICAAVWRGSCPRYRRTLTLYTVQSVKNATWSVTENIHSLHDHCRLIPSSAPTYSWRLYEIATKRERNHFNFAHENKQFHGRHEKYIFLPCKFPTGKITWMRVAFNGPLLPDVYEYYEYHDSILPVGKVVSCTPVDKIT